MDRRQRVPSLRAVEAFIWIGRLGSYRAASQKLNVTVSALSRRIQALEADVGHALIDRSARDLRLTDAGRRYMDDAQAAFDALVAATARLAGEQDEAPIRISVGSAFNNHWLTPRLPRFLARRPTRVELVTANDPRVQVTKVDASIWFGRPAPAAGEEIGVLRRRPVCHPSLVKEGRLSTPRDLAGQTIIGVATTPTAWRDWAAAVGLGGLALEPTLVVDNLDSALHAASQRIGVALGVDGLSDAYAERGELAPPFGAACSDVTRVYLILNPAAAARPAVRAFRQWLTAEMRAWQAQICETAA